jgi:glycosyltransferase involved in cell wall biosynthesis
MPKVSVIIPTYNRAGVVKDAIASVLAQSERDIEVLVVDDGSTDDTRDVVTASGDGRVRCLHKANGGAASARNLGLSNAGGSYIAFLDSDDLWPPDYLDVMLAKLQANEDVGVAYASIARSSGDGTWKATHEGRACASGWVTRALFSKGFVSPVAVLIRREALAGLRFDESLPTAEDSDFFLRLSVRTRFLYVPDVLVRVRMSPDSLCATAGPNDNRVLSLERFYFQLGGKESIPWRLARKKLSHACRQAGLNYLDAGNKRQAIRLLKKAVRYWPADLRLYRDLTTAVLSGATPEEPENPTVVPGMSASQNLALPPLPEAPLVSIVTPSYNQAAYLEKTILSVLGQDYPNIEYIVIDGGSTDGSVEIIKKYQSRLSYWVSEPDRGQSNGINKGFARARGEILNWLNSDDLLMPSAVSIAVRHLMSHPQVGMIYGDRLVIDSKGNVVGLVELPSFQKAWLKYSHRIPQETAFFRRQCWQDAGTLDETLHGCLDYDLWVRLSRRTGIHHIPFVLGAYRTHALAKSIKDTGSRQSLMRRELAAVILRHFGRRRRAIIKRLYKRQEVIRFFLEKRSASRKAEIADIMEHIGRKSSG